MKYLVFDGPSCSGKSTTALNLLWRQHGDLVIGDDIVVGDICWLGGCLLPNGKIRASTGVDSKPSPRKLKRDIDNPRASNLIAVRHELSFSVVRHAQDAGFEIVMFLFDVDEDRGHEIWQGRPSTQPWHVRRNRFELCRNEELRKKKIRKYEDIGARVVLMPDDLSSRIFLAEDEIEILPKFDVEILDFTRYPLVEPL